MKDGRALRTEMMFNNTQDFGLPRGLKNFSRLFDLGRQYNNRLLDQETLSQDCFVPLDTVQELGHSTTENGQRASALRFADRRVMAVLGALAGQSYIPQPLGNASLRPNVAQLLGTTYSRAQMTYDLRRLRLKKLIERIGNTHHYRLTDLGIKVVTFFTKLYQRLFRPGLAALLPEQLYPSDLAQALSQVSDVIQSWAEQSSLSLPKN